MDRAFFRSQSFIGFSATLVSFLFWGIIPVYWEKLFAIPSTLLTSYRVIFSFFFVLLAVFFLRQQRGLLEIARDKREVLLLLLCGVLIGVNWWFFIAALATAHVLESSLGYYINPLMNALIGMIFFREYLSTLQKIATLLMLIGVGYMVLNLGEVPLYGLALALSFAIYGALHKLVKVNVMHGMFFEMLVLLIPAILSFLIIQERNDFFAETGTTMLLIALAGPVTILPLIGYAMGVKRLKLITVGVIQYSSPTVTFLLGIFFFKEPFSFPLFVVFFFIWLGVILYIADGFIRGRQARRG
ncbi:MAG: EamA family transporter RarD [Deferribacteraceae bacterium]|jgi:chloramphenicol-sensitive protein RarD|nr:EamA family transporter RarD [Deferribacteraceae bacterium]